MYLKRPTLFCCHTIWFNLSPVSLHTQAVCATQREERPGRGEMEGPVTAEEGV
jgi:hypothetical protein